MKSEQQRCFERSADLFRAGSNSSSTHSGDLWQLYVGFGFIGSLCWFGIVVAMIVNGAFHAPNLVGEAKEASLFVLGISSFLVLIFIPGIRGKERSKLLTFISLPLCLFLVIAQITFLSMLAAYPVQTEYRLGEAMLGKYPCREWGCKDPVSMQAKWWISFIDRYAGTAEADHASVFLVANLWALDYESQKIEVVEALMQVYCKAPDRHRQLMDELLKRSVVEDDTGRIVRDYLQRAEAPDGR